MSIDTAWQPPTPAAPETSEKPAAKASGTLMAKALDQLRLGIVRGVFPPSSKLNIDALREQLGVSHSPLREALAQLVADGLVSLESQKGFRVAPVSIEDLADITTSRLVVEHAALKIAIEQGDDAWEAQVLAAFHQLSRHVRRGNMAEAANRDRWEHLHAQFHAALIAPCRSRWLIQFRNVLYDQMERYRRLWIDLPVSEDVVEEHRRLMEVVLNREADAACVLLEAHVRLTYDMVVKMNGTARP